MKRIYNGPGEPAGDKVTAEWLDNPPPWRKHDTPPVHRLPKADPRATERGERYVVSGPDEIDRVNLALWLRRPLLVTGEPGVGKSTLAYAIASALDLGPPLVWEINSQTTLRDGLYSYDAVAHFRAARDAKEKKVHASQFVRLGPLGTAFVPTLKPRVLLVDELDKAPWDLPNDLLHVFEEGAFTIPELAREKAKATVQLADSTTPDDRVALSDARVVTRHHPVVVITSNQEREFSPAFKRRCVQLHLGKLALEDLKRVVLSQLGDVADLDKHLPELEDQPTDVVLQTLFALSHGGELPNVFEVLKR